jgi:nitroimidazol reductase NimA-like FMN-containing flavoprotein (pyridoxamine 5'-phosphate oxidase superfamily)
LRLAEIQRRSYQRAGPAILGSWPASRAMNEEQLARYLARRRYCVLATATPSGAPQARPVAFVLLDDAVWFATVEGARLRNLRANPRVSVVIAEGDRGDHAIVLLEGVVGIHADEATRTRISDVWREQHGSTPDWAAAFLELRPSRVYSHLNVDARV